LHKRSTEATGETDAEAEEPEDIYVDSITLRREWVKRRRGQGISIGDLNKFLSELSKKPGGHLAGIRLEVLVTFDEKCGNRRGEYTSLENGKWVANDSQPFEHT